MHSFVFTGKIRGLIGFAPQTNTSIRPIQLETRLVRPRYLFPAVGFAVPHSAVIKGTRVGPHVLKPIPCRISVTIWILMLVEALGLNSDVPANVLDAYHASWFTIADDDHIQPVSFYAHISVVTWGFSRILELMVHSSNTCPRKFLFTYNILYPSHER